MFWKQKIPFDKEARNISKYAQLKMFLSKKRKKENQIFFYHFCSQVDPSCSWLSFPGRRLHFLKTNNNNNNNNNKLLAALYNKEEARQLLDLSWASSFSSSNIVTSGNHRLETAGLDALNKM